MRYLVLLSMFCVASALEAGTLDKLVPRPKTGYERPGVSYTVTRTTPLRVTSDPRIERAYAFLQKHLKSRLGDTLVRTSEISGIDGIVLTLHNTVPAVKSAGYTIDISSTRIELAAADADGFFNGVSTLLQLLKSITVPPLPTLTAPGVWIWDGPDYTTRWAYSGQNLLSQGPQLRALMDTMSMLKINGLQHADWNYAIINVAQPRAFDTIPKLRAYADARNIEIIPTVMGQGWSSNILYQNPNLATGFPAKASYTMTADVGVLIPDARVTLPNGNFETLGGDGTFTGWGFYDGAGKSIYPDKVVKHSGEQSARMETLEDGNPNGNARFSRTMPCEPETQYSMECYVKTEGFTKGFFQLLAIGKDAAGTTRTLTFTQMNLPATSNGWVHAETRFNTLEFTNVILYAGVWGGSKGKLWVDDFRVWPSGMCNVLRREGCPIRVRNATSGQVYNEGVNFEPIVDNIMLSRRGEYGRYHTPPALKRIASGAIKNGDVIDVDFYHPLTCVSDTAVSGSTMNTMSNDSVYIMLAEQTRLVNEHLAPSSFFLGHDEIRALNRDAGDNARQLSARAMLAQNILWCDSVARSHNQQAKIYIWNDMIDSTHNAVNNFYLINGDLRGIWNDIPKHIIAANWLGTEESLRFMASKGFSQITCPYYDAGDASTIRQRRIVQDTIPNILGSMYTTWYDDYSQLRAFSSYMWHAGPFIEHRPLTKEELMVARPPTVTAIITPDPFDSNDDIRSASYFTASGSKIDSLPMTRSDGNVWSTPITTSDTIRYRIGSTNSQGITQYTPWYVVIMNETPDTTTSITDGYDLPDPLTSISVAPNPTYTECLISSRTPMHSIAIIDDRGSQVLVVDAKGALSYTLHVSALSAGSYTIAVDGVVTRMMKQ